MNSHNTHNALDATLNEILRVVNPSREDIETRMRIIDELRYVVSSIESLKGATVEPFGSFLSQLFTRWGDLDISIELSNGSHILVPAKKHKQMLLGDLIKALRRTGSFRRLQFVSHARVPILKLETRVSNISCDISINNLSGHMKSKFLLWISLIDRRFRDMVLLVKEWAKANDINNPRSGTFNSYSLSLLIIFHFQTCTPAILPPLKDLYPGNMADELIGVRADAERHIEETALNNIARFRKVRRANHSSLSELFISFLGKFLDIDKRTADQGICTYSGQWENISTNTRWLPKTFAMFIEDPFEQPANTARAVSRSHLTRIGEVFRNTYSAVINPNQNRNALIPSLVRHEIFQLFPGVAFVIPRANVRPWPNRNVSRGNLSPSLIQHQFQKVRQVNHPKNLKVQNGKQVSAEEVPSVNQQLPGEKTRNRRQNSARQKTAQGVQQWQGPMQPVQPQVARPSWEGPVQQAQIVRPPWQGPVQPPWQGPVQQARPPWQGQVQQARPPWQGPVQQVPQQISRPPWPHTLQPNFGNNVASQLPFKVSPAQAQAQQVWRQKQSDM